MHADMTMPHQHKSMSALTCATIGVGLTAGALILSPYVLPLVGIGSSGLAVESMAALHTAAASGSGLAGLINSGLAAVPFIGENLAEGGLFTAAASGAIGLSGMLLGNYVGKREDGTSHIKWGKIITVAALATSALIALPTALTGISAGIVFLAALKDSALASSAVTFLSQTIGAITSKDLTAAGATGATLALSHLLTCGAAAAPPIIMGLSKSTDGMAHSSEPAADTIRASVKLAAPTRAGQPASGVLILKHADGSPVTADELHESHTKKIHFFINNSSLTDYQHIHPLPNGMPGEYAFNFTPNTSQPYEGWATIVTGNQQHAQLKVEMPPAVRRFIPANVQMNSHAETGGLTFDWKSVEPLQQGVPANIEVTIKDKNGKEVTDLKPLYGAWCHLEGFSADHSSLIHTHPIGREPAGENDRMSGPLRFTITPEKDGPVQFYAEINRNGQHLFAPFGQYVKAPEKATSRQPQRTMMDMAMPSSQPSFGIP